MTHDELLARLSGPLPITMTLVGQNKVTDALRAVVELHKPIQGNTMVLCSVCMDSRPLDAPVVTYPCLTIRAIEKELA